MNNFSPFDKSIYELEPADILTLIDNQISENWFIEYKRQIPCEKGKLNNDKILKSVASFANTKGGWIFWGIESKDNVATEIQGIDVASFKNIEDQIAQVISSNIFPTPIYHLKQVVFDDAKVVFVIQVEESPTPPYITSSGQIYQRENNCSVPIKDRYVMEKLNEKTQRYKESIESFSDLDLGETVGQSETPTSSVELYFFPLPFDSFDFDVNFYSDDFFNFMTKTFFSGKELGSLGEQYQGKALNLGLNNVFSSSNSYLFRSLNQTNLIYKNLTIELFNNGNLKAYLPLHEFGLNKCPEQYRQSLILKYIYSRYFSTEAQYSTFSDLTDDGKLDEDYLKNINIKESESAPHVRFIDSIQLILNVLILFNCYSRVLKYNLNDEKIKVGCRLKIQDFWRRVVFFEDEQYLAYIKACNLPISPKDYLEIPTFKNGNSSEFYLDEEDVDALICDIIINGLGFPQQFMMNYNKLVTQYVDTLINARIIDK